jgi:hypothetical protein
MNFTVKKMAVWILVLSTQVALFLGQVTPLTESQWQSRREMHWQDQWANEWRDQWTNEWRDQLNSMAMPLMSWLDQTEEEGA